MSDYDNKVEELRRIMADNPDAALVDAMSDVYRAHAMAAAEKAMSDANDAHVRARKQMRAAIILHHPHTFVYLDSEAILSSKPYIVIYDDWQTAKRLAMNHDGEVINEYAVLFK